MRRLVVVAVLLAAIGVIAHGQGLPPRDSAVILAAPKGTAVISGVVFDADKKPLRRAEVAISGDMRVERVAISDDQGRFAFVQLPAGRYSISASKGGYVRANYGAGRPGRPGASVLLRDAQQFTNVSITLIRGAVIEGTVRDEKGQPLPGQNLAIYLVRTSLSGARDYANVSVPRTTASTLATDDRGMFRLYGLPPGDYIVGTNISNAPSAGGGARLPTDDEIDAVFRQAAAARSGGERPAAPPKRDDGIFSFAGGFHPDAQTAASARVISLAAGEERAGVDITVRLQRMLRIEGIAVGPNGPLNRAPMSLARRTGLFAFDSTLGVVTGADGRFSFTGLVPADYTVLTYTREAPLLWALASVPLSGGGADVTDLTLMLQPMITAKGQLVFDGTANPIAASRLEISFSAIEGVLTQLRRPAKISATGELDFEFAPGQYRISAAITPPLRPDEPGWMLESVKLGDRDVTDRLVDISVGEAVPPVTITFTDKMTELAGSLQLANGQPATDVFVVALPAERELWASSSRRIRSVRPDANGRYVFPGLPPGRYRIAATTELETNDLRDFSVLDALVPASAEVTIAPGEKKTLDLKLGGIITIPGWREIP
jgi:hypothetical protein